MLVLSAIVAAVALGAGSIALAGWLETKGLLP